MAIRPIAYSVMKLHRNVIPYYDKEDYLQEAYITLYRVLKRIESKPDILNSFQAYLWQSIKNTYCGLFRDYVLHHLIEIRSYENRENGLTYSQMVYFQEYAESYYSKNARAVSDIIGKIVRQYLKSNEKILQYTQIAVKNSMSPYYKTTRNLGQNTSLFLLLEPLVFLRCQKSILNVLYLIP